MDAAYAIWKRVEAHKETVETILEDVIAKYQEFILSLVAYAPVIVISAPLQTISDCRGCGDETSRIRSSIDISIEKRTAITLKFNQKIKNFCSQQGIDYFDFDFIAMGKNGIVRRWLIQNNPQCQMLWTNTMY